MLRAGLYILACSARNRARRRFARLREPRYLLGAGVGSVYLAFMLMGRWSGSRAPGVSIARDFGPEALFPALGGTGPGLAGVILLAAAAVSWLMPVASGLLEYSETEVALLFPAPVSRRQLLMYRLLRAQWTVFIGAAIFALTYPVATIPARIRGLVGGWLLLMTCHVFFTGITLARLGFRTGSRTARRTAGPPMVLVATGALTVGTAFAAALWGQPLQSASEVVALLGEIASGGLARVALWPFTAATRPLFAESFTAFAWALPAALAVYAATVVWVLRADETLALVADRALGTVRTGKTSGPVYRARTVNWTLPLHGRHETAFVWKSLVQTLRVVDARVLARIAFVVVGIVLAVASFTRTRGLAQAIGILAAMSSGFAVLLMPQILRQDLRQDLEHLDLLKTWPVPPGAVIRGEIAWPALVSTGLSWACAAVAIALSTIVFSRSGAAARAAVGLAGMIVAPAVVCAQYTIHNAAALLFPAWVPAGRARARGVGATGQRLIIVGATWLMLLVMFTPGLLAGGAVWLALSSVMGAWSLLPAALVVTGIVAVEVLLATEGLGPIYERLDITSVERGD